MELDLIKVFMERDGMDEAEAEDLVEEMRDRVAAGEDPEEVLREQGLEPDYIFEIMP